jgi:hypothetical protein
LVQQGAEQIDLPLIALAQNIDRLTKTHREPVDRVIDGKRQVVYVEHDPLLDQLNDAVTSNQTYSKKGGSLASQRNVLDASALMLQDAIRQTLTRNWTKTSWKRVPRDLTKAVDVWHRRLELAARNGEITAKTLWRAVNLTKSWAHAIEQKFDPPITLEVTRPCPLCDVKYVHNDFDERVAAVVITWRKSFEKSFATCRACDHSWYGESELRQLRWEIDKKDDTPGG